MPRTKPDLYAFLSAADQSGPAWEIYARRLGAPLALGLIAGAILYAIIKLLPAPFGGVFVIVLGVTGFAWAVRELRATQRLLRSTEETLRRIREEEQ